jgi:hypothetical protein
VGKRGVGSAACRRARTVREGTRLSQWRLRQTGRLASRAEAPTRKRGSSVSERCYRPARRGDASKVDSLRSLRRTAGQGLTLRTRTRQHNLYLLVQPPIQTTLQSSNREPSVTGVRRRKYFVSICMLFSGLSLLHTFIPLCLRNSKPGERRKSWLGSKGGERAGHRKAESSGGQAAVTSWVRPEVES